MDFSGDNIECELVIESSFDRFAAASNTPAHKHPQEIKGSGESILNAIVAVFRRPFGFCLATLVSLWLLSAPPVFAALWDTAAPSGGFTIAQVNDWRLNYGDYGSWAAAQSEVIDWCKT